MTRNQQENTSDPVFETHLSESADGTHCIVRRGAVAVFSSGPHRGGDEAREAAAKFVRWQLELAIAASECCCPFPRLSCPRCGNRDICAACRRASYEPPTVTRLGSLQDTLKQSGSTNGLGVLPPGEVLR